MVGHLTSKNPNRVKRAVIIPVLPNHGNVFVMSNAASFPSRVSQAHAV